MMGLIPPLVTEKTAIISDELNHNCIITRLRWPAGREAYLQTPRHGRVGTRARGGRPELHAGHRGHDGIFSMRGDHAPLDRIMELAQAHDGLSKKTRS